MSTAICGADMDLGGGGNNADGGRRDRTCACLAVAVVWEDSLKVWNVWDPCTVSYSLATSDAGALCFLASFLPWQNAGHDIKQHFLGL